MDESNSKLSWFILGFAILALAWGIWLKVNEKKEAAENGGDEEEAEKVEWVRVAGGKLINKETKEPFQGVRQVPFELAQDLIEWEYTYVDGIRHGPAVEYFPSLKKRVKSRSTYVGGKLNGPVTTYHERSGAMLSKCNAVDGWLTGLMTFYDRDGRVTERQVFEKSAPTGEPAIAENPPLTIEEIDEGIVAKPGEIVDEDGDPPPPVMLDADGNPWSGTQVGTFYGGGKAFEHRYNEGREHGKHEGWNPEGKTEYQREYYEGENHGTWKHWAESGVLITEETYHYGLQVGSGKRWHPNEQLRQESEFVHGAEHGVRKIFGSSGKRRRETTFDYGIQTHMIEWNSDGSVNLEESTPLPGGLGVTIPTGDAPVTQTLEITELPEEEEEITIGFRYRVSTDAKDPPPDAARIFTASLLQNGEVLGDYEFEGELGGWHRKQWVFYFTPGEKVAIQIDAEAGDLQIDIAGAAQITEPFEEPVEPPPLEEEEEE